jgi:hypothetical protein
MTPSEERRFARRIHEGAELVGHRRPMAQGWTIVWLSVAAAILTVVGVWAFAEAVRQW